MRKGFIKRAFAAALAVGMMFSGNAYAFDRTEFDSSYSISQTMRGLSAFQIASDMGAGWNL